jgi:hypothetical protein
VTSQIGVAFSAVPATMPDAAAVRRQLEEQARVLASVAARLHDSVAHPPIAPSDWHGPASAAYAELEHRLRRRVAAAEHAVHDTLQSTRLALAQVGG